VDEGTWASVYSTRSRPFVRPTTGKIAVKVINQYGDEVLKVFAVGGGAAARRYEDAGMLHEGRAEAERPNAVPVALMNGEQLVRLLVENDIGVHRTSYDLIELGEKE
jgi:restriction endonuclease Mrr